MLIHRSLRPFVFTLIMFVAILGIVPTAAAAGFVTQTSGTSNTLRAVYFRDASVGLAVGDDGVIRKTLNGGSTWTTSTSGTTSRLNDLSIISGTSIAYVVGEGGVIRKSSDLGTGWSAQTSGTTETLTGVYFRDASVALAVGDNGVIRKTLNGGSTWKPSTSGTTAFLKDVFIVPGTSITYVVGEGGVIRKSIDLGTTWSAQTSGTMEALAGVYFVDASNGWVVGASGTILHTINGGSTWTAQTSGTGVYLLDVYFTDSQNGWAVGNVGVVVHTTNGGTSWSNVTSGSSTLYGVHFVNASTGWAVGLNGAIRHYDGNAPDTTITSSPDASTTSTSATFSFTATETSEIGCSLDGGAYFLCTSPNTYSDLAEGSHTFQVRSTDAAGNTDPTPASFSWTIDTTPPSTPTGLVRTTPDSDNTPTFTWNPSTDNVGVTGYEFTLVGFGSEVVGVTTYTTSDLAVGNYTINVRATDAAENFSSAASLSFEITAADSTPPATPPPPTPPPTPSPTPTPTPSPTPTPPPASGDECAGFTDVSNSHPDCPALKYVKSTGAMTGNADGTFAPGGLLQRDQIAKITLETFKKFDAPADYCGGENPFPDVTPSDWSYQYICRGKTLTPPVITGYLSGADAGFYRPERSVNHVEFLAILLRNLSDTMPNVSSSSYLDVSTGQWFSSYSRYSYDHSLFSGSYLFPERFTTRIEVAQILYKLHQQGKI